MVYLAIGNVIFMVGFIIGKMCAKSETKNDDCKTFTLTEEQREALHEKYSK